MVCDAEAAVAPPAARGRASFSTAEKSLEKCAFFADSIYVTAGLPADTTAGVAAEHGRRGANEMMRALIVTILAVTALQGLWGTGESWAFFRADGWVDSEPGVRIFVREIKASMKEEEGSPVLLIHGGGPGSVPNFDPTVPHYSLAEDIAGGGHFVYMMDVRGFGKSAGSASAVRADEAVKDISAVVDWILHRCKDNRVALVGLGAGGHWAALYATKNREKVSHLVLLNVLYGVKAPWPAGKAFEDPKKPGGFDPAAGGITLADAASLMADWDRAIPDADKTKWRDPRVAAAYVQLALAHAAPDGLRIPGGFRREHFEMAQGKKLWDARDVRVPTLYARGTLDHWSRPEDLRALHAELVNAPSRQFIVLHGSTHFLHLDRPEKGRAAFLHEVLLFLGNRPDGKRK